MGDEISPRRAVHPGPGEQQLVGAGLVGDPAQDIGDRVVGLVAELRCVDEQRGLPALEGNQQRVGRLTVLQAGGGLVAEPALDAFQCGPWVRPSRRWR
jgi:hypothetical protein